ncbi:L,D-transpeptidase family protein [Vibrio marisflavi]|nr:L,D-transpeptidase family protein [Vibrio marisflavi]
MLLVTVPQLNDYHATLRLYQRASVNGRWQLSSIDGQQSIPAVIGKNGLAWSASLKDKPTNMSYKKEGDGRTPVGAFALPEAFGISNSPHPFMPYIHVDSNTVCVDDSNSNSYNKVVNKSLPNLRQDWSSAEQMADAVPMYNAGLIVSYNPKNEAGKGSCIFVHQWRSPNAGTAGCTAMDSKDITYLVSHLKKVDKPVLVVLPTGEYSSFDSKWGLPALS